MDTSTQIWYTCMRTNFIKGNQHISQCLLRSFESLSYPTHELPKPIRVYTWPRNAGCQLRKASGGPWANVIVRFFLGSTASFANKFRFSKNLSKLMVDVQLCLLGNLILAMTTAAKKFKEHQRNKYIATYVTEVLLCLKQ